MNDDYRDPRKDPRPDDVLLIKGIATQVIDADPDDGVEAHDITGQELDLSLSDWQDFAARSVVLWQDDAPPPADVALLRAERDKLLTILGFDGPYAVLDVLQILADAADHLLSAHSCDRHGWETVNAAADSARRIVESVNDARADAPPPADVSLLASANRTRIADLEAARADVERVTAERNHFARVLLAAADASGRESCVDMVMAMESATGTMGCRELAAELRRLCGVSHA